MTLFGLVRHGQTEYNRKRLFQGSSDIPLNETGIAQAHDALDRLPDVDWDVVITSPLQRAEQTGRIIAEDHAIPFGGTDPRLVEIDWGAAEGQDVTEMERRHPGRSFPGREDHQAVADRGFEALEDLAQRYPGQKVLIVAHGTLIRFILSGIIQRPLPALPNATLSLVELDGATWRVRRIAGCPVDHAVTLADPAQHPRFTIDEAQLTPSTTHGFTAEDPAADEAVDADGTEARPVADAPSASRGSDRDPTTPNTEETRR